MSDKFAGFIIANRRVIMVIAVCLAVVSAVLMLKVEINEDMTKYLPDDSAMKTGIDIMASEFPETQQNQTIRAMFTDLTAEEKLDMRVKLESIEYVDGVSYMPDSEDFNRDNHTLYIISTSYAYGSFEELSIESALRDDFSEYKLVFENDDASLPGIPIWIIGAVLVVLIAVLLIMCASWIEPFLFLAVIGAAIVINMGTNIIMGSVSSVTFSIAAILQLVLSMDYSIILINRYRQESAINPDKLSAMRNALKRSFAAVSSSSLTTVAGLLMLTFMSFNIGMDLGIVIAKGVFISMVCVLTVMPGVILGCDKLISKTQKKEPRIPVNRVSRFSYALKHIITCVFVVLFIGVCLLQSKTDIAYTLHEKDLVADVFPPSNTLVMVYENADEQSASEFAMKLAADENVSSVMGNYAMLSNPYAAEMLSQFVGDTHSRLIIDTTYPEESELTNAFIDNIHSICAENFSGDYYLIGDSAMVHEMRRIFDKELILITLLTALAIYLIVALTFRSLIIPLILVLVVQTGVYLTISILGLRGGGMYYLALLIVECVLMGATIDYGILFTHYYRESRASMSVPDALKASYASSIHTILTSGSILVLATMVAGRLFEDPIISAIVNTVSVGAACATLLILFVLPGLLAALDRFIRSKR